MSEYPKAMYRPGSEIEWDGHKLDYRNVADAEEECEALSDGWYFHYAAFPKKPLKQGRKPTQTTGAGDVDLMGQ